MANVTAEIYNCYIKSTNSNSVAQETYAVAVNGASDKLFTRATLTYH